MNRHLLDPRVFAPLLLGALAFAPRALPQPEAAPPERVRAVELPQLPMQRRDTKARTWRLDAEGSSVRFLAEDGDDRLLVACPTIAGELRRDGDAGELVLRIELASATPLHAVGALDLHRVLGVRRADEIVYRGKLVAAAATDLPGVERLLFLGQLAFGDHVMLQPMQLWACALPGRPLRLQGNGPVATSDYGLPTRGWLGVGPDGLRATLGLDLEWIRDAR